jgi:hypothetical protein
MNKFIFSFILFFCNLYIFGQVSDSHRIRYGVWPVNNAEYLVVSNDVNLRNSPSVNSEVIGRLSFPEIVYVAEIQGSNEIINGVVDRWARIIVQSNPDLTGQIWINCYYIASFPLIVSSRAEYDTRGVCEDDTIFITGYYRYDGRLYFRIEAMLNVYYHDDITYNIVARPIIQGIPIIDNSWTRLYNFCDSFRDRLHELSNSRSNSTENPNYIFDYGVKIGMESRLLVETLGNLFATENTKWNNQNAVKYKYSALYIGAGHEIEFIIFDNKIVRINYIMIK